MRSKLIPNLILCLVICFAGGLIGYSYARLFDEQTTQHHGKYEIDLPEEIQAATPSDTMNAVLHNDTIYITFKTKQR